MSRRWTKFWGPLTAAMLGATLLTTVAGLAQNGSSESLTREAQARVQSNRDASIRAMTRHAEWGKLAVATYAGQPSIIASLSNPSAANSAAATRDLALLGRSTNAPAVFLSDLAGRNAVIYPPQPALLGKDFAFRDWFQGVQRTGAPYVSAGYRSAAQGRPLASAISTPVRSGSRRVGYLTMLVQLDAVRAVAEGARQDGGVIITITDQTGQAITDKLSIDDRGQPLVGAVDDATRQALAGISVNTVRDRDLLSAGRVPSTGWTVSASLPKSAALAPARSLRQSLATSLGASLLLVAIVAALAIRAARRRDREHDAIAVERARLTALFAASPIGIMECEPDSTIVTVNEALASMLGYQVGELIGTPGTALVEPEDVAAAHADVKAVLAGKADSFTRERRYRAKDGSLVPAQVSAIMLRNDDGSIRRIVAFLVDLRQQKEVETALRSSEQRLTQLALFDELTRLPNRRLLFERCADAFNQARATGGTVSALFVDLDGFKAVNDLHGHERGDALLADISADLRAVFRPEDTVARVGGDEFVVLLGQGGCSVQEAATHVTATVRRQLGKGAVALTVTASVGVATIDLAAEPLARPDELLSRADSAMYLAKEHGRDRHESFRDRGVELPVPRPR